MKRYLPGMVAQILVGSSVAVSHELITAPLLAAQTIRYAEGFVLLVVAARVVKARVVRPRGVEWLYLSGIAAIGLALFNVAVVRGVQHAEPAAIAVAVACVPIVLGVIGPLMQHRHPSLRILAAAGVVTAGSVVVEGTGRTDAVGIAWAAVALACEAAFTLLAVPVLDRQGAFGVSIHSVWIGAIMLGVLSLVIEGPGAAGRLDLSDWLTMAYLAVAVTAAAFVLWYSTVSRIGPGRAGLLTGLAPAAAAVIGAIGGQGVPSLLVWAGIAVVVGGLAIGLGARERPKVALTVTVPVLE